MKTDFAVNGSVVSMIREGKPVLDIPYKVLPDGSMIVGNRLFGPPPDPNKPMEHGDGSGGGGGGAGQSTRRTRRDGKNVGGPRPGSRLTLSAITEREKHAMGLAWKMVKNNEGELERRLELVSYQASGPGKKKKPGGKKKKGKKKGGSQPNFDDDGAEQGSRGKKPKRGGKRRAPANN